MKFVSSISGLPISAGSAAYAPTNGADVSAIASAYQVVSATGTQTYAGTAYVTSLNSAPVSAERAGNAANAALANSAWYDGTGRFISALPDSAAVSAIASAYAESAASGKQDALAFAYNAANQISSINGSALGGMDEAAVSGIASSYAESAASSKQDITAMTAYALSADVSGCIDTVSNNSASWGGGGATGDYVEKSSTEVSIGTGNSPTNTAFAQGSYNSADAKSFCQGDNNSAALESFAQGLRNSASGRSLAQGVANYAIWDSIAQGDTNSAYYTSFAQGQGNTASGSATAFGWYNKAYDGAFVIGKHNLKGNGHWGENPVAFTIGNGTGTATSARHDLLTVSTDGEITVYSSTADTTGFPIVSSIRGVHGTVSANSASWGETAYIPLSSTAIEMNSTAYSATYGLESMDLFVKDANSSNVLIEPAGISFKSGNGTNIGFVDPYHIGNWDGVYNTVLNNSAIWDSASAVSGKQDVFSAGEGLEFVQSGSDRVLQVEAPVDIVAGPGIVIDNPDGNTLRVSCASAYETLLWSGFSSTTTTAAIYNLSENLRNFLKFKVVASPNDQTTAQWQRPMQEFVFNLENNSENGAIYAQFPTYTIGANTLTVNYWYLSGNKGVCTSLGLLPGIRQVNETVSTGVTSYSGSICQIWGINRTASN